MDWYSLDSNPLAPVADAASESTQAEARWEVTNFNHTMIDIAGGSYAWGPDYQQVLSHLRETESQLATAQAQYADSLDEAKAEIERLEKQLRDDTRLIAERDDAEEAIGQAYCIVVGHWPEWSNAFGHDHALEEIKDKIQDLMADAAKWKGLYEKAWEECEDMREREPVGPSTNPGIVLCRLAHDTARREAGLGEK